MCDLTGTPSRSTLDRAPSFLNIILLSLTKKQWSNFVHPAYSRALSFLIRYFSNYYTLHRSDLAARAAPLDPRSVQILRLRSRVQYSPSLLVLKLTKKFTLMTNLMVVVLLPLDLTVFRDLMRSTECLSEFQAQHDYSLYQYITLVFLYPMAGMIVIRASVK